MSQHTLPPPFRVPSGRLLRGAVSPDFEQFYRETLRFRPGGRLRSIDVAARYQAWAEQNGAPSLNMRELRRAMFNIGHRHFRSNVTFYGDVQLAEADPSLPDNFPAAPIMIVAGSTGSPVLAEVERIIADLERVRSRLAAS